MTKWLAQQTLAKMRLDLSISRPGVAINEKMALEMAIDALGVQQEGEKQNEQSNINGPINP
ncbi:hypothetical protein [Clostridium sp. HBUAS56010]|uniref:hypothetical protein n=1 Tax=Clostridium sp. HBUAS56010 TaxID=2571127 RepID=UPI00117786AC|nr:hypothetical protein [Clostridium sp. HBUAS56010]